MDGTQLGARAGVAARPAAVHVGLAGGAALRTGAEAGAVGVDAAQSGEIATATIATAVDRARARDGSVVDGKLERACDGRERAVNAATRGLLVMAFARRASEQALLHVLGQ